MAFNLKLNVNGSNTGFMTNKWGRERIETLSYPTIFNKSFFDYQLLRFREAIFVDNNRNIKYGGLIRSNLNPTILPVPLELDSLGFISSSIISDVMPVDIDHSRIIPINTNYRDIGYNSNNNWDFLPTLIQKLGNKPIITNIRTSNHWPTTTVKKRNRKTVLFYHLDESYRVYQIDHNIKTYPGEWVLYADAAIPGENTDKKTKIKGSGNKTRAGYNGNKYSYGSLRMSDGIKPDPDHCDNLGTRIYSNNNVININLYNDDPELYVHDPQPHHRNTIAFVHLIGSNNIIFLNYHGIMRYCFNALEDIGTCYGMYILGSNNMLICSAPDGCDFTYKKYGMQHMFHHLGTQDTTNALYLGAFNYIYGNIPTVVPSVITN